MPLNETFWTGEREKLFNILFPLVQDAALIGAENAISELGIGVDWQLVNKAVKKWAKKYSGELVGGITDTTKDILQKKLADWIESGKPLGDLIKDIEPMFDAPRAKMIATTEVTKAFSEGNQASWKASEVVDGKKWMTAQDDLVCPICGPLSEVEADLNGDFEGEYDGPPAHPNCRCWLSPVIKL
jgi:SPP1 gp7 family putative phage head morphogenesis protein